MNYASRIANAGSILGRIPVHHRIDRREGVVRHRAHFFIGAILNGVRNKHPLGMEAERFPLGIGRRHERT